MKDHEAHELNAAIRVIVDAWNYRHAESTRHLMQIDALFIEHDKRRDLEQRREAKGRTQ